MIVISGVPGREEQRDATGKVLEGAQRRGGILPSWLMAESRNKINELPAGPSVRCRRATSRRTTLGRGHQLDGQGQDPRADGPRAHSLQDQFLEVYCH
jgi:hypothetical protein